MMHINMNEVQVTMRAYVIRTCPRQRGEMAQTMYAHVNK
jgi:hypothetical protein